MIGFDPQANMTVLIIKTYANLHDDKLATIKSSLMTGITDNPKNMWDKKVHKAYADVANEMINRLEAN